MTLIAAMYRKLNTIIKLKPLTEQAQTGAAAAKTTVSETIQKATQEVKAEAAKVITPAYKQEPVHFIPHTTEDINRILKNHPDFFKGMLGDVIRDGQNNFKDVRNVTTVLFPERQTPKMRKVLESMQATHVNMNPFQKGGVVKVTVRENKDTTRTMFFDKQYGNLLSERTWENHMKSPSTQTK